MLTDRERMLVAASLEGDLPSKEAKDVRGLLEQSPEARSLLAKLVAQRDAVRQLPKAQAPVTLAAKVQSRIAENQTFDTIPASSLPARRMRPSLVNLAIAASVVMAFTSLAFWVVRDAKQAELSKAQADALPRYIEPASEKPSEPAVVVSQIPDEDPAPFESQVPVPMTETAPTPRAVNERLPVYGSPFLPPTVLESVLVKLPLISDMKELTQDSVRRQLATDLARSPRARIDLFTADPAKAVEVLQATGRAMKIHINIDPLSQERNRRKATTGWVLFTEALTPEEATQWIARLAAAEPGLYRQLHLPGLNAQDEKEYKDLLGAEWNKPKLPASKSVSDSTLGEISESLSKTKSALLVSAAPPGVRVAPSQSAEIKHWLDQRNPRKPGTVSLMFVIR